ncbi:hypothetical protein AG1IA_00575 [Rhizoctonia solani AG-1 IA]|uniref:Uncharacterized protein n=1 Tax=Thanatephorus cucumeris (strain AG1-IA) TaxID=983506 RepID=L8X9N3_THACA|nr:hypothetical protein AG1IA_00575 [Rhizoctonia solani AG-1 IA]
MSSGRLLPYRAQRSRLGVAGWNNPGDEPTFQPQTPKSAEAFG